MNVHEHWRQDASELGYDCEEERIMYKIIRFMQIKESLDV